MRVSLETARSHAGGSAVISGQGFCQRSCVRLERPAPEITQTAEVAQRCGQGIPLNTDLLLFPS